MELRSYISKLFKSDVSLGIWLIVIFTVARFALVLNTNLTGSYGTVWMIFVVMAIMPFLLLKRAGRSYIGVVPAQSWLWILGSLLLGALACVVVYGIFTMFYGHSIENCFAYIYRYAEPSTPFDDKTRFIMFLIFSATTMTFSPIGEELLYRGVIHGCFAQSLGDRKASIIDRCSVRICAYLTLRYQFYRQRMENRVLTNNIMGGINVFYLSAFLLL